MPAEFFYVILLLVVAVIFGWFYLKRAQARTPSAKADGGTPQPASVEETAVTPDPARTVEPTDTPG